jgi:hypothetical protein
LVFRINVGEYHLLIKPECTQAEESYQAGILPPRWATTIMLAQGVPLKTVNDILGHTDDDQKRSAAEKIADLFGSEDDIEEAGT